MRIEEQVGEERKGKERRIKQVGEERSISRRGGEESK